jgi:hypothetical protein
MTKSSLEDVLRSASTEVLETMFFAEAAAPDGPPPAHTDALACSLLCSGAREGIFTAAIDREALQLLCEAFYGDDGAASAVKERELLCELTNMLAGSTLSAYVPEHYCPLSSPLLCDLDQHLKTGVPGNAAVQSSTVSLGIDGGLLSISCALKVAA